MVESSKDAFWRERTFSLPKFHLLSPTRFPVPSLRLIICCFVGADVLRLGKPFAHCYKGESQRCVSPFGSTFTKGADGKNETAKPFRTKDEEEEQQETTEDEEKKKNAMLGNGFPQEQK
jgi:hypothetical protein